MSDAQWPIEYVLHGKSAQYYVSGGRLTGAKWSTEPTTQNVEDLSLGELILENNSNNN